MSKLFFSPQTVVVGLAMFAFVTLSACSYDYLQHTDRVAHSAGNAVRANLVQSTINPSSKSMNSTSGLGKNGVVVPIEEE